MSEPRFTTEHCVEFASQPRLTEPTVHCYYCKGRGFIMWREVVDVLCGECSRGLVTPATRQHQEERVARAQRKGVRS